ncbi:MAG: hypothetical protein ACI9RO_000683, partial [Alteromonas macleodii]
PFDQKKTITSKRTEALLHKKGDGIHRMSPM